jgi:integrase
MMRKGEKIELTWDRIDLATGLVVLMAEHVKTGSKTGKGRKFIMSPLASQRMQARYEERDPESQYVFPSATDPQKPKRTNHQAWTKAKKKAGITGRARWHDLRHTALTWATLGDPSLTREERSRSIQPVEKVSEYAGVSIPVLQRVYLHGREEHTRDVSMAVSILQNDKIGTEGVKKV